MAAIDYRRTLAGLTLGTKQRREMFTYTCSQTLLFQNYVQMLRWSWDVADLFASKQTQPFDNGT
jgi:hypothetical protein